ncbi:hypothetical protein IFM89_002535 [Coptis chinensis]|uniref:RING-type E3 ubiquitin transferase n=1 Tax=Coptis chinensis TaxID=261450 RepID=A0A835HKM2_9MAGN|nr:hypothetical protein IFM89_002535 [Coptis chinensis]
MKKQQLISINFTSTILLFGLLVFLSFLPHLSSSIVHFKTNSSFSFSFIDAPARFCNNLLSPSLLFPSFPATHIYFVAAVRVNSSGVCGALYVSDPHDACSSLRNSLRYEVPEKVWFVLIERGNCAFEDKVQNAQESGFRAAIVYDNRDKEFGFYDWELSKNMGTCNLCLKAAGEALKKLGQGEEGECCITPSLEEAAWTVLILLAEFHTSCVDSWLTKWGTFCPVCKHDMSTATAEHMPNQ